MQFVTTRAVLHSMPCGVLRGPSRAITRAKTGARDRFTRAHGTDHPERGWSCYEDVAWCAKGIGALALWKSVEPREKFVCGSLAAKFRKFRSVP